MLETLRIVEPAQIAEPTRQELILTYSQNTTIERGGRIKEPMDPGCRISVVIPVLNEGQSIKRCLESLARQDFQNFETIVVDNGSRDKTPESVLEIRPKVPYPLHLVCEQRKGPGFARKRGMDEAILRLLDIYPLQIPNHLLAMIDGDAVAHPRWLSSMLEVQTTTRAQAVGGVYKINPEIDAQIEANLGFPNFFNELADLAMFLISKDMP